MHDFDSDFVHGFAPYLMKKKKFPWLSIPNRVGSYEFTSSKCVIVEYKALQDFYFRVMSYQKHDHKGIFVDQVQKLGLLYPYEHLKN